MSSCKIYKHPCVLLGGMPRSLASFLILFLLLTLGIGRPAAAHNDQDSMNPRVLRGGSWPGSDDSCPKLLGQESNALSDPVKGMAIAEPRKPLFQLDPSNFEFRGLTADGLVAIRRARDVIRGRERLFENEFRNLTTIHHAGLVARLFMGNMFLYGPPGGAKSAFVNWLIKGESEPSFRLQLHQMITEHAFTGGQNFKAAKAGRFEINTKGSLADAVVGLIDETDKGNPAAFSALLSLLNEREVLAGNKVVKARLETLFATSNANLPEFLQQFVENGLGSTGPALLNRFQFKALVYNWLSPRDQAILDARREQRRYLEALAKTNPEVLKSELFLSPETLDWVELRRLAHSIFRPSELFLTVYRELVNDMRKQTNDAIRESEELHKKNHLEEPFVYFPSADYTERLRQQIPEIILMSAFIDFLGSPLSDDANLQALTAKPIELDPLSLWRGYLVMTTLGPGEARLRYTPNGEQKVDIDFDWAIDPTTARDQREELLIRNLKAEQERFRRTYLNHLASVQSQIQLRAQNALKVSGAGNQDASFEFIMARLRGK